MQLVYKFMKDFARLGGQKAYVIPLSMFVGGASAYPFKLKVQNPLNGTFCFDTSQSVLCVYSRKGNFLVVCSLSCLLKDFEAVCGFDCLEFPIGTLQSLSCSDYFQLSEYILVLLKKFV